MMLADVTTAVACMISEILTPLGLFFNLLGGLIVLVSDYPPLRSTVTQIFFQDLRNSYGTLVRHGVLSPGDEGFEKLCSIIHNKYVTNSEPYNISPEKIARESWLITDYGSESLDEYVETSLEERDINKSLENGGVFTEADLYDPLPVGSKSIDGTFIYKYKFEYSKSSGSVESAEMEFRIEGSILQNLIEDHIRKSIIIAGGEILIFGFLLQLIGYIKLF
jgi:hypothetical protein